MDPNYFSLEFYDGNIMHVTEHAFSPFKYMVRKIKFKIKLSELYKNFFKH